jgi:hypothetical protein
MLAAKVQIAAITSVILAGVSLRLRRHFTAPAILGALLLLCSQSTFLERASELRVDMLSALFGLISLLAFLERRAVLAGVAAAGAVLMTQKGAYFVLSLGGATAFLLLRWRRWTLLAEAARMGLAAVGAFAAYVCFWCVVGSPKVVWQSMFEGPRRIAFEPLYDLSHFWTQTLERNPIFYALGAAGWLMLCPARRGSTDTASERLWAYSLVHVALCIWHKQPWPYFFVMLIPTIWVLGAAALDRLTRVLDLQDAAAARPMTQMLLRVENANGGTDSIRVGLRDGAVGASIDLGSRLDQTLPGRVEELQRALQKHGLELDSVRVRSVRNDGADAARLAALPDADAIRAPNTRSGSDSGWQRDRQPSQRDTNDSRSDTPRHRSHREQPGGKNA